MAAARCTTCGRARCPEIAFYRAASEQERAFMRSGLSMADILYLREKGGE